MSKKTLLPLCLCVLFIYTGWIQAQTIDVSGIVVYAEDNEPVIGANVQVKGTQQGGITVILQTYNFLCRFEIPGSKSKVESKN